MHRDASRCALGAWCLIEMYSCRNIKDINVSDLSREPCRVVGSYWRHQDQQCSRRGVLLTPLRCLFQILLLLASTSTQTKMGYELHLILRRIFGSPELSLARPSSARHKSRCYSTRVLYNIRKHRYCAHCCSLHSSDAFVLSTCVARVALPTTDGRRPTTDDACPPCKNADKRSRPIPRALILPIVDLQPWRSGTLHPNSPGRLLPLLPRYVLLGAAGR